MENVNKEILFSYPQFSKWNVGTFDRISLKVKVLHFYI